MTPQLSSNVASKPEQTSRSLFDRLAFSPAAKAIVAAAALACGGKSDAGITPDGVNPQNAIDMGLQYGANRGVLFFRYEFDDINTPGLRITRHASAVMVTDTVVLTSAHVIDGGITERNFRAWVGTGSNYLTNPGTLYPVASWQMYPDYVDDSSRSFTIDLAVLRVAVPITDATPATFATQEPASGSTVIYSGFGRPGTPSGGYLTADGHRRAGISTIFGTPPSGQTSEYYVNTSFRNFTSNINGLRPASGDSGGATFNGQNELIGLTTYAATSSIGTAAGYLRLTHPHVQAFIAPFITPPHLSITSNQLGMVVSWPTTTQYKLQTSYDLTTWTDWPLSDIQTSSGTNSATVPTASLATTNRQFFRLAPVQSAPAPLVAAALEAPQVTPMRVEEGNTKQRTSRTRLLPQKPNRGSTTDRRIVRSLDIPEEQ